MWRIISAIIIVQSHMILGKLIGDHVCQSEESYPANVTEYRLRNATFRNYKWCMNVPPRCSYYTVKTINESRIVEKILTRTVEKCCDGYAEENEKCVLKCTEQCKNGKCNDGICSCSSGFKGASCDVGCDLGTWGPNCSSNCNCESKTCDPISGTCLEDVESTVTSSPKPSTPSQISINGKVSKFTIIAPSTSTETTSLRTDKSTNATDTINHTESTTQRSHASSTVATTNESSTLNDGRLTEAPSSISSTPRLENVTESTTSVTNSKKSFTTKSTQHVPESTTSSYQPEQYISGSSTSLGASVTTPPFHSTLEHTTSLMPTQGVSQTSVPPKSSSFGSSTTTRVMISKSKEASIVSPNLNTFVASSTEQVLIDTTVRKATPLTPKSSTISTEFHSEDKVVTATSEQAFLDTTVTKSTPTTQRPSSTEAYFNESLILKEPLTTPMLETKSTTSWVNNISQGVFTASFNSSVKIYSNDITENHPNTSPIAISTSIPPKHAEDHLDKPADVINLTKTVSSETKESSLDDILKEYTIPVEVKYEIPAHKKEAGSTHENYAEEKNYLTLEDRGYINKHVASDSEYFVNSFTAVAVVVLVVAVLVMIVLGWNNWRGKKALESRDPGRKDAAVYTTSIFHTPLPDPPIIENPTYLLTTIDCKKCNGETLLLKAHPTYPIHRMSQMGEVREYVYDHPPSTGSYRAASAVDPSDVSCSTEISEPVYDEIPLRNGVYNNVLGANTEPNMCLYVNTVGRTKF